MLALLGAVLLTAAGCGGGGLYGPAYVDPYIGAAELDNLSVEYVEGFYMAPAATTLFTGELLGAPLPPGSLACRCHRSSGSCSTKGRGDGPPRSISKNYSTCPTTRRLLRRCCP